MRSIRTLAVAISFALLFPSILVAADTKEDPAHEELRALLKEIIDAFNKSDIDKVLTHLDDDVVVTWMNSEVSRKPQGVREYIEKMTKGANKRVEKVTFNPTVDELSRLHAGSTIAVAWGKSEDHYILTDGLEFDFTTRWTATLIKKEDGQWKISAMHASGNVFDNPIQTIVVKKTGVAAGGTGGGIGLIIGAIGAWLLAWFTRRKTSTIPPQSPGTT